MRLIQTFLVATLLAFTQFAWAQGPTDQTTTANVDGQVIDGIVAVVGDNIVLLSELESQRLQALEQGVTIDDDTYCFIMEELLFQKLLLHQADIDSVEISEGQIQSEMDRRLRYFISQLGSQERLEEFYGKSIAEIKAELHDLLEGQLKAQQVQQSITSSIKVTPSEVRAYFEKIPKDSLPLIDAEVEMAQIMLRPVITDLERQKVIDKLNGFRDEVLAGTKSFETLAILYSKDPGSAKQGGKLGMTPRSSFVPEFSAAAFELSPGEMSAIVETDFGFHLIQMIERRGEEINCRHILLKPNVDAAAITKAKVQLDSLVDLIRKDSMSFEQAAARFSQDEDSKNSNGIIANPYTGSSRWNMDEIDPTIFLSIDKMEEGQISDPVFYQTPEGVAYRLIRLNMRTKPHRANMRDDYQLLQNAALQEKKDKEIDDWIRVRVNSSHISITEPYRNCTYKYNWMKKG